MDVNTSRYKRYVIELVYLNGNKEIVDNMYNYTQAMCQYKQLKVNNQNKFTEINFVSIKGNTKNILFTKKYKRESNQSILELLDTLNTTLSHLETKQKNIGDQISLIDKRKNVFEHKFIEFVDINNLSDIDKSRLFDEYRRILLERRELKNEFANLQMTKPELDSIITNNKKLYEKTKNHVNKTIMDTNNMIQDIVPENVNRQIMTEFKYKNHKERVKLEKELKLKYDKVFNDESRLTLICYNKSKSVV